MSDSRPLRTAELLLDIDAVRVRPDDPFKLASGRLSPVYIDCRRIISFPGARSEIADMLVDLISTEVGDGSVDNIAGGETAGIPFAALVADRMGLPMTYVRKKPKGYGRQASIEGEILADQRVLLVEDLATDGGSKIQFAQAIREAGADCRHTAVVFNYGIFADSKANLAAEGLALHGLCTWKDLLEYAERTRRFTPEALQSVAEFLSDPECWQQKRR